MSIKPITYHFLRVTPARPDQMTLGSGTDHTICPHVASGDEDEKELAVRAVSNPSSPFSPAGAHSQVSEKTVRDVSKAFVDLSACSVRDCSVQHTQRQSSDLVVQRRIGSNIAKGICM